MTLILKNVEVRGNKVDVRVEDGLVDAIGRLDAPEGTQGGDVVDGLGGALLPGLHDHHLHLLALAASMESVDCSHGLEPLATARPRDGWVRGVGLGADADRHVIDAVRSDVPVRVQHRSGGLWVLNSTALRVVGPALDDSPDVERGSDGQPTGRLWRYDARLRPALPRRSPDLSGVVAQLHAFGITGVTDATPDLSADTITLLSAVAGLRVTMLGGQTGTRKLLLRDHDLPMFDELCAVVAATHENGRPVAVHCVTRESLLLTLAALDDVGVLPGDRIEHAAVVPPGVATDLARLGLAVVTQPGFLADRGDDYLRDVHPDDVASLYPYASLLAAGVPVTASSDAPFGPLDPWAVMRSAARRVTASGAVIGPGEAVGHAVVLNGYLSPAANPGGRPRRVEVGAPADLCLLHVPLAEALRNPDSSAVRATYAGSLLAH